MNIYFLSVGNSVQARPRNSVAPSPFTTMAGNTESDIGLHRKVVELGDQNKELVKQSEELLKHYYSMKAIYKDKVKDVVQNHSAEGFIVESKDELITDLQRLFIKTERPHESAPLISVPNDRFDPQGTRVFGNPEPQAVPQVPRVIAPTRVVSNIPRAFAHTSGRSAPH